MHSKNYASKFKSRYIVFATYLDILYVFRCKSKSMYLDLLKRHTILNGEINTKLRKTQMNKLKKLGRKP